VLAQIEQLRHEPGGNPPGRLVGDLTDHFRTPFFFGDSSRSVARASLRCA
jgi:hypothetical protein